MNIDSICVKEFDPKITTAPHILPIYATSSFCFDNIDQGIEIFNNIESGNTYSRYSNPTVDAVAAKIAQLESHGSPDIQADAILTSSGMSAISTLAIGILQAGDAILTQENLYGGTTELFRGLLEPLGITTIFMNLRDLQAVEDAFHKHSNIRLLYFETPSNPTLACLPIRELAELATRHGALSCIDNTFATPYLQQPLRLGVDLCVHSTTKFLNGHGNSIAGAIVAKDKTLLRKKIWNAMKLAGTNCSPFEAWLTHNGLKTLAVRMERHCKNAQTIAEYLENHPNVAKVNYPGLPSHADHAIARAQMSDFGAMLSFELKGGFDTGVAFMNRLRFCTLAPTLGDTDTLVLHPASSSHLRVPPEVRLRNGITDGLIRLSVGIENVQDIINDLEGGFSDMP
ncbi:unnamed protein product [Darwinula stevensoni]|uniref:plant cystathionine gamma-synthase n=1 Tax=Darwinula stevensoni TaxID=69355 RepID=A0A7R9A917_9CRUS|nr:unnamed protein product [Darwinula stevensoni]CAG0896967.1 unnamed protein product [Darwinula stevensoni]